MDEFGKIYPKNHLKNGCISRGTAVLLKIYWLFLQKKLFFPQNAPAYRALFWLFYPIIQCVFKLKIPKKLSFLQIAPIIQGILLTFLPKKVFFFSKCACISSTILTFLPNYPVCFYTKNSQKVNFSSNWDYNTGHFIDFSPKKKVIFSSKCACISSTILTFLPNNPVCFYNKNSKKVNIPQIAHIIQGTCLTFLPKNANFVQNTIKKNGCISRGTVVFEIYWLFSQKKLFFPQNAPAYRALF